MIRQRTLAGVYIAFFMATVSSILLGPTLYLGYLWAFQSFGHFENGELIGYLLGTFLITLALVGFIRAVGVLRSDRKGAVRLISKEFALLVGSAVFAGATLLVLGVVGFLEPFGGTVMAPVADAVGDIATLLLYIIFPYLVFSFFRGFMWSRRVSKNP